MFGAPPQGFETEGSPHLLVGEGLILSTFDYGCLWQAQRRGRPASREEIRSAMEWGENLIVLFAAGRKREGFGLMSQVEGLSYDQVPYPSLSHANTHPDNLAVMAILAGLHPAPLEKCRVLELGAASGGNLIPMAYGLPHSQFLGIDISGVQIAEGKQKVQELGLTNLQLEQMDILDFSEDLGQFDYIIAHGIFSWVPPEVRESLIEIYRTHLAPQGVGFISYNTYPGWYMINIARDIMRFNTRGIEDPQKRATEARSALQFYANALPENKFGYFGFLKNYSDYIDGNN